MKQGSLVSMSRDQPIANSPMGDKRLASGSDVLCQRICGRQQALCSGQFPRQNKSYRLRSATGHLQLGRDAIKTRIHRRSSRILFRMAALSNRIGRILNGG